MASQELINIIIKATDEATATANKVDASLQQIDDDFDDSLARLDEFNDLLDEVYPDNFDDLSDSVTNASSKIQNLEASTKGVSSTLQNIKSTGLDKLRTVTTAVSNGFSKFKASVQNAFTSAKAKVSGFANTLKGKVNGAIDQCRAKMNTFQTGMKSLSGGFGFVKSAASMAVGMIGFELVNSLMETTRASMNARSSIQAFGGRLNMSAGEVSSFQSDLDKLQRTFKKVDMDVVGQQAMDMAYRLGLPKSSLTQLTETSAIFTDAMQRNGRSAEDATLALADAMDGEFKRLKEIGISQEDLMKNGWSGDINDKTGLLKAMNGALKDQHYDELAKSVDNLDDAWQVLTISLSNLLEQVLVPLTPAILTIIDGVTGFIDLIQNNAFVQGAVVVGGLAIGFALLAGAIAVAAAAEGGLMTLMPGFIVSLYGAASGFMAITVAGAPLWAIVAAVAAIAFAIYEVGIAFGWWHDVGSMLDAISSGVMRLWNAFINHPDVQAAISAISGAISVLWGWIQQAGQAILDFFGISTGGDFDIVRALIDGIGNAWNMLKMALGPVIGAVQNIIQVFDLFRKGQIDLPQFIWSVLGILANMYVTIFTRIGSFVGNFALKLIRAGINMARNFVLGIINRLKQLPGKVFSALMMVVSRLLVAGSLWVSTVKQKALDVVNGAYNTLTSLPGKIASALSGVVDAITKPFKKGYEDAKAWWDKMTQLKMPNFQAGEPLDITGSNSLSISSSDNGPIIIEDNINLTVDLKNIPAGMSADTLITALQDKNVLNALVSNRDFQSLDAQVKQKISLKKMRSGGI